MVNVKAIKTEKLRSWDLREGATSHKDSKHRNVLSVKLLEAKNQVELSLKKNQHTQHFFFSVFVKIQDDKSRTVDLQLGK